jgi:hypothetical protein
VAKWLSDQSLVVDTLWLVQAFMLCTSLLEDWGGAGWVGLAAFGLHKVVTLVGLRPATRTARRARPLRLLLLRVFTRRDSQGRRVSRRHEAERPSDPLGSRWRYVGPIHMIGAPDLAASTMDPDKLLDFLAGRPRQRFLLEPGELPSRLAALDEVCDFASASMGAKRQQ